MCTCIVQKFNVRMPCSASAGQPDLLVQGWSEPVLDGTIEMTGSLNTEEGQSWKTERREARVTLSCPSFQEATMREKN